MGDGIKLRVHHVLFSSRANGPGKRAVVWLQGCSLRCPCCCNPALQDFAGGHEMTSRALAEQLEANAKDIEGITISGGEPTEQIGALIYLLSTIKEKTSLSVLLFSGKTFSQIQAMERGSELLCLTDIIVDGPYNESLANPVGVWPSSSNQNIIFLTSRYSKDDVKEIPCSDIFIGSTGDIIKTGLYGWTRGEEFRR
ncbi:MAG: 4Fe-4S single cluster domain-containing protein [Desulfobacterales bacterium]